MAALLVALSIMAVLATAVMPVWKQMSQREKEEELIFRGQQYMRAIRLFTQKAGPGVLPPNVDVLVQQRFLRKKFKDPITGQDFDILGPTQAASATPGVAPGQPAGRGTQPTTSTPQRGQGSVLGAQLGGRGAAPGGVMGVVSKSKETSIRLYNGRNHYNEWQFLYVQQAQQPGAGGFGQRGGARGQPPGPAGRGGIGGVGGRGGPGRGFPPPGGGFPPAGGGRSGSPFPAPANPRPPQR
jgi:type II secretory pathway pseudopilin PulG